MWSVLDLEGSWFELHSGMILQFFDFCAGQNEGSAEAERPRLASGDNWSDIFCSCRVPLPSPVHLLLCDVGGEGGGEGERLREGEVPVLRIVRKCQFYQESNSASVNDVQSTANSQRKVGFCPNPSKVLRRGKGVSERKYR